VQEQLSADNQFDALVKSRKLGIQPQHIAPN